MPYQDIRFILLLKLRIFLFKNIKIIKANINSCNYKKLYITRKVSYYINIVLLNIILLMNDYFHKH